MENDATPRKTYSNCLATLDLDHPRTRRTLKEDPIYQEAIDQVFTYSLTTDIECLQDSLHLTMNKTDIEKYHTIINQKKDILQKQLK